MAVGVGTQRRREWLPAAVIGLLAGIDNLAASLAIASLIFTGPLSAGLGLGVGVIMVGGAALALVVSLRSTLPNSVALVQESTVAIVAAAVATATAAVAGPIEARIATAVAILGVSSLATGALFWITGRLKLGGLARFMPYPVVAGFLAGSGWLLVDGSMVMLSGHHIGPAFLSALSEPGMLALVLPAIAFAAALYSGLGRFNHPLTLPLAMIAAGAIFFAVLSVAGISIDRARGLGYFPQLADHVGVALPTPHMLFLVDWNAVLLAFPTIVSIAVLSIIGLMLNISGLELAVGRDIDVNAELKSSGIANMLSGAMGGPSGYVGLTMTTLAHRTGAHGREAGVATALAMIVGLAAAGSLVFQVPVFITAGFVLFMGIGMLKRWLVETRRELPRAEWLLVVFILVSIAVIGFLEGLAVGLLVSIALFVFNYARQPVVRLSTSGIEYRSSVDRSSAASRVLTGHGDTIEVIQLQGFLFFGSADRMVRHVQRRLTDRDRLPLRFLILDFRHVSGLDSAATSGFLKIRRTSEENNVQVFLTHLSPEIRNTLTLGGISLAPGSTIRLETDIDHALEQAEETILREQAEDTEDAEFLDHLTALVGPHPRLRALLDQMTPLSMQAGDVVITAGERASDMFFVARGRLRVEVTLPNGRKLRLRTMTAGAVVGEIALYLGQKRTADVVAETAAEIYRFSAADLSRLETEDAELAVLAHRLVAINLCEKLTVANQAITRTER